jgi:hypothetical protein
MKKLTMFALLASLIAILPAVADTTVNQYISADDVSAAILVKYVGTATSATVASASTATMTFEVSAAAYTGFECPVSGALGGIIDVTNASCNTLGEVVDTINGNCTGCASDFRAVIVDGLRSDSSALLLTVTTAQATTAAGVKIPQDTSANFAVGETRAMIPAGCRDNIQCWIGPTGKLLENPYGGTQTVLNYAIGVSTYGSGDSYLNIYSVKPSNKKAGAETVTTLWHEVMGATTVSKAFSQFQYISLVGLPNEKMVVRISNSAAQASVNLLASGYQRPVQ